MHYERKLLQNDTNGKNRTQKKGLRSGRIEHRKMIKNNVQELLLGNDWLKNGGYTPSRKLQENVSYYELECMPLSEFLQLADLVTAESPGTYTMNDLVRKLAK